MTTQSRIMEVLGSRRAIEVLQAVEKEPGKVITAYCEDGTSRTLYKRLIELEEIGLIRFDEVGRYNAKTVHLTVRGVALAKTFEIIFREAEQ